MLFLDSWICRLVNASRKMLLSGYETVTRLRRWLTYYSTPGILQTCY